MRYDVEVDWFLLYKCNLRCPYCAFSAEALSSDIRTYATPREWKEAFDATGKTWLLHITGGEPGIYPDFTGLCEQLAQTHYLSINSNLAHTAFNDFAQRVDPERVHFFQASLHYEVRRPEMLEAFVRRVQQLREAKFAVLVNQVMTPGAVRIWPEISKFLEGHGLAAIPKTMRGPDHGCHYPGAYTAQEKALIVDYMEEAREKYGEVYASMSEPPTIDLLLEDRFLDGFPDYRGSVCAAGSRFVSIEPNGTVWRCGRPEVLGNVLFRDVRFLDAPRECDTSYCGPCFCEKYCIETVRNGPEPRPRPSVLSRMKGTIRSDRYLAKTDGYFGAVVDGAKRLKNAF